VDTKNPERRPLLIISGERDNAVPWAIANASYKRQKRNEGVTEIVKIGGAGMRSRSTTAGATVAERWRPYRASCRAWDVS
jgi:hypothetical protein